MHATDVLHHHLPVIWARLARLITFRIAFYQGIAFPLRVQQLVTRTERPNGANWGLSVTLRSVFCGWCTSSHPGWSNLLPSVDCAALLPSAANVFPFAGGQACEVARHDATLIQLPLALRGLLEPLRTPRPRGGGSPACLLRQEEEPPLGLELIVVRVSPSTSRTGSPCSSGTCRSGRPCSSGTCRFGGGSRARRPPRSGW